MESFIVRLLVGCLLAPLVSSSFVSVSDATQKLINNEALSTLSNGITNADVRAMVTSLAGNDVFGEPFGDTTEKVGRLLVYERAIVNPLPVKLFIMTIRVYIVPKICRIYRNVTHICRKDEPKFPPPRDPTSTLPFSSLFHLARILTTDVFAHPSTLVYLQIPHGSDISPQNLPRTVVVPLATEGGVSSHASSSPSSSSSPPPTLLPTPHATPPPTADALGFESTSPARRTAAITSLLRSCGVREDAATDTLQLPLASQTSKTVSLSAKDPLATLLLADPAGLLLALDAATSVGTRRDLKKTTATELVQGIWTAPYALAQDSREVTYPSILLIRLILTVVVLAQTYYSYPHPHPHPKP